MVFCGFGLMLVGIFEMVVDVIEDWVVNVDIDGFNVVCKLFFIIFLVMIIRIGC